MSNPIRTYGYPGQPTSNVAGKECRIKKLKDKKKETVDIPKRKLQVGYIKSLAYR